MSARPRAARAALVLGVAVGAYAIALARLRLPSGADDALVGLGGLPGYWMAYGLLGAALTAIGRRPPPFGLPGLLLGAAAARVGLVLATSPELSDDLWRYIHDGATLAAGENPYALAPAGIDADQAPVPAILDRINHPELVTIYQPTSQLVFAALSALHEALPAPWHAVDPHGARLFRLGFAAADVALVALIAGWLRSAGRSPAWAALYAFHPLVLGEVAATGHQEPIGIALLVAGLWAAERAGRTRSPGRASAAGAGLAASAAVKPVAIPVALPLLWRARRDRALLTPGMLAFALTAAALYAPFLLMPGGLVGMTETARVVAAKWAFNGGPGALLHFLGGCAGARAAGAAVTAAVVAWAIRRRLNPARVAVAVPLAGLLLAQTVHPWYLLWPLAFAPLALAGARRVPPETAALWIWSLTIPVAYVAWLDPLGYHVRPPFRVLEYAPVLVPLALAGVGTAVRVRFRDAWRKP